MPIYIYAAIKNEMLAVPRYIDQRQYLTLFNPKWGPVDLIKSAVYGFNYTSVTDLVQQIRTFLQSGDKSLNHVMANNRDWLHTQKPLIDKIVFDCHGHSGLVYLDSAESEPLQYANAHPFGYPGLNELADLMTSDATVMFLSCLTGRGRGGTELLTELSNNLKNKQITTFSVSNGGLLNPKGVLSRHGVISFVDPLSVERIKKKLSVDLPSGYPLHATMIAEDKKLKKVLAMRLDAESPYAKTAYNGYITKSPLYDTEFTSMETDWAFLRKVFRIIFLGEGTPAEKVIAETYLKRNPSAWNRYEELSEILEFAKVYQYQPLPGSPLVH